MRDRAVIGPTPDGYYLIYMIGSAQPHVADCAHGVDPEWVGAGDWLMSGHIAMGYSRSPEGPWSGEQSRAEQTGAEQAGRLFARSRTFLLWKSALKPAESACIDLPRDQLRTLIGELMRNRNLAFGCGNDTCRAAYNLKE